MDGFAGYYGQPYPGTDAPHPLDGYTQDASMSGIDPSAMDTTGLGQAQTLHQIISQNSEELMRRRNHYPPHYRQGPHDHGRRASMLEFSSNLDGDLANFQFDPNPNEANLAMAPAQMVPMQKSQDPRKIRSREDLSLNTQFSRMNTDYENMQAANNFSPGMMPATSVSGEQAAAYMPPDMDMTMDFDPMETSTSARQEPMFTASPVDHNYPMSYQAPNHDPGGGSMSPQMRNRLSGMSQTMSAIPDSFSNPSQQLRRPTQLSTSVSMAAGPGAAMASPAHISHTTGRRSSAETQNQYSGKSSHSKRNYD